MGSAHRAGWFRGEFLKPPAAAGKTVKPRLRREGNAPLLSPAATSPPEGEILAALIFEFLMRTKDEWQEDFPLRGKWCVSTKRGAFPRAKPGCTVLRAKRASRRKAANINCGEAATIPFEPSSEPFETSEPELQSSSMAPPQPSRRQAHQTLEPLRPQGASNFGPEGAVKPEKRAARRPSFHICSTSLNALI